MLLISPASHTEEYLRTHELGLRHLLPRLTKQRVSVPATVHSYSGARRLPPPPAACRAAAPVRPPGEGRVPETQPSAVQSSPVQPSHPPALQVLLCHLASLLPHYRNVPLGAARGCDKDILESH